MRRHDRERRWRSLSFSWLILLFTALPIGAPKHVQAQLTESIQDVYVDDVRVEGNQRIETEAILSVVETEKGTLLDPKQLDQDLRDIYGMKYFTNASVDLKDGPKGKIIIFKVIEKPSISEVIFEGNLKQNEDALKEEIGIKLYSLLDENEIKQSVNRLTSFYRQKGFYNAEIESKLEVLPNNEVRLKYVISEGEKVYITEINFIGNTHFDDAELRDQMETDVKGFFSWLTSAGYLDKKKLEYDIQKITAFYHNHGFINARLGEPEITYNPETKSLTIAIQVDEGKQYAVGAVSVKGDLIQPADKLLAKTKVGQLKVYNRETIRNDVIALRNIYVDEGYAYADVTPLSQEDEKKHLVDITYDISKGPKIRFERIDIIGNTITRDKVIRRELAAVEGEYFSGKSIQKSKENLDRLGFFESVEINTQKGSRENLMNLEVKVQERATGSFSLGAGYSSQDSIFAMFQVSQSNLFGRGQRLDLSARLGGLSTLFELNFHEPWLFDTRLSGNIGLYNWSQEYEDYVVEGINIEDYTRDSMGGRIGLGYPVYRLDEYTRASFQYEYDDSDIGNIPDDASPEFTEMEGRNVTSSITLGLRRDTRNKPWNTTKGSVNSIYFAFAGRFLGGDVNYNSITATSAWYFPLYWDTVFLLRGSLGYMEERAGGKLPIYQKYRLGGLNSVRGFEYASISPIDENGYRIGGERMMHYTLEYRVPVVKEQGLMGLVFFDCGNVFESDEQYTFSDIRKSAGFGFRWYSPMGPLRLEYGKNLDPKKGEESGRWEFSMGGSF